MKHPKAFEDTLAKLINKDLVRQNEKAPLIVPAGASVTFKLEGVFNLSVGNEYQESTWEGKLTLRAVQANSVGSIPL